jgi:phage pi2 protein 07
MAENLHNLVLDKILVDQTTFNNLKQDEKFEDKVVIENNEYEELIRTERLIRQLFQQHHSYPIALHLVIDRERYEHLKAMQSFVRHLKDSLDKDEERN